MKNDPIDYLKIGKAQQFYRSLGYKNIKTPWIVSTDAILVTIPPERRIQQALDGALVASGEQGFIQMMMDGELEPGIYQTATPCFRDEPFYDETTLPWFIKLELISYMPADWPTHQDRLLSDALNLFRKLTMDNCNTFDVVDTSEGKDIMCNGIELGSYGVRYWDNRHMWVYGTGIAEPRFSIATGA